MRPLPHKEEFSVSEPPENITFSDGNYDSVEDLGQQEGDSVVCDPTFEASCSSSEPRSLTQGDINDFARVFNLSTN
jgi:hypothetical protein